jgi:hypothetical protein
MNYRSATVTILFTVAAGLVGWDFIAYFNGGQDATISKVMVDASTEYPMVTLVAGILMGHFFWQMKKPKE